MVLRCIETETNSTCMEKLKFFEMFKFPKLLETGYIHR